MDADVRERMLVCATDVGNCNTYGRDEYPVDVTDARSQMQLVVSVGAIEVRNAKIGLVGQATRPKTNDPKVDVGFDPVSDMFVPGLID